MKRAARFLWPWLALAAVFALAPRVFSSGTALTMMSLMGVMIVFALSYNMLLGQTGLLSFGHAVYYGLGGFVAIHAMNAVIHGKLGVPVAIMPTVGGLAGLAFGVLFGLVSVRRAGLVFSMISLGIGELVSSNRAGLPEPGRRAARRPRRASCRSPRCRAAWGRRGSRYCP